MHTFLQFVILGLGVGGIYAFAGSGMVLIYRGSGVVNFSHGGMAILGAYSFHLLRDSAELPTTLAFLLALAITAAAGALIHVILMRRLSRASGLTRAIATLGILTVIQSAVSLKYGASVSVVSSMLPTRAVHIGSYTIGADRLIILAISAVLSALLWAIYRFSVFGHATSAVAENPRAASALGISTELIATANWAIGSALAGAGGIVLAPIVGLSVSQLSLLLVPALSAALVGSFSSFTLTWVGGLAIGIAQSVLVKYVSAPGWSTAAPFLVVAIVLCLRGNALPIRGHVVERMPRVGAGRIRLSAVLTLLVGAGLIIWLVSDNAMQAITTSAIAGILGLSVIVITGYAGQLSLAQYAMAGVGAYLSSRFAFLFHLPFWLAGLIGIVLCVPVGVIFGLPSLRTRGVSLGIITLGFALAVEDILFGNSSYTGGLFGTTVPPPNLFGIDLNPITHDRRYAFFCVLCLLVAGLLVANLRRGRPGRRMLAIRANERAASSLGVSVARTKLYAFAVASALAGMAGVLTAFETTNVLYDGYDYLLSINLVVLGVLGGIGYVSGSLFVALGVTGGIISYLLSLVTSSDQWLYLIIGVLFLIGLCVAPDGGADHVQRTMAALRRRIRPAASAQPGEPGEPRQHRQHRQPGLTAKPAGASETRVLARRLTIESLTVRFGNVVALQDVSVEVAPGEILGVIGPNGAGKTTLIDAITGITGAASGTVRLDGAALDRLAPDARARAGLVRSFQSLELFDDLSVIDNLRVASDACPGLAYVSDLIRPRERALSSTAVDAITEFGLAEHLSTMPTELSYGSRRLLAIARAAARRPSILLLDEPAAGLDESESAELGHLLRRLVDEWGVSILLVEHDMDLVMRVCDRVAVLNFGTLIGCDVPDRISADPDVIAAYLGEPPERPDLGKPDGQPHEVLAR